ncbi:kinesin-like protein KIN-1 [Lactuca sativa]|uniref:kinesin-like protein KIN-1 n=1 Tax=Lactuca sativa TaxID=4236 RepID=UPI0022AFE841|nr:kinesin-like protein KIN-1 [Lactuca sativa]
MASICVCARFRPLNSREDGEAICITRSDSQSFSIKDEKDEQYMFSFDKVFYEDSEQADVYEFLAGPIVRDAVNSINGTIITYGQTGAGKTFTMEGANILEADNLKKGLLPRVVDELFDAINGCGEATAYKIKLSMVEIYMERVRDLFDLSKDNIQIKEHKSHGILLSGATEIPILDGEEALKVLCGGIANRAVGETQMNAGSSRSHCIYMFTIQKDVTNEKRVSSGKVVLVDLAGSEKVEKTGAEGKVLEEAKTINKSLSALGNVISALTSSQHAKSLHIPFRDSKLTRLLQDALGGSSQTALLCCCSPSLSNSSESVSTLRFGARAKHIKASSSRVLNINSKEDIDRKQQEISALNDVKQQIAERILKKLREKLDAETVNLIGEEFVMEGLLLSDPTTSGSMITDEEELNSSHESVITSQTIASWKEATQKLVNTILELRRENVIMKEEWQVMKEENKVMRQVRKRIKAKLAQTKKLYLVMGIGFGVLASSCFSFVLLVSS